MTSLNTQRAIRPARQAAFLIRKPFDALWNLFGSVRLAIGLITALVALGTIGMFITQAPREVVTSAQDYASWLQASARMEYGDATDPMNWFQLFTIFGSWYFKTLVALLAINILVGGMLQRAPGIWQKFRHSPRKRADGFYLHSPVKVGLTVGDDNSTTTTTHHLARFFHQRGFRVATTTDAETQSSYLYVHKYTWSMLSTFVFHTCLIGIMASAILTGWGGFGRNARAQQILPAPVFAYFQDLAGFSYTAPMPDGAMGVVYPVGTPHNIFYRADQFVMTVDPQRMTPTDFYTDIEVFQDGKLVAKKRIRVNDPLTYQGVTFHQASFMMYTAFQLRDATGNVIYSGPVPLFDKRTTRPDPNSGNVLQTNNAEDIPFANNGDTLNIAAAYVNAGNGAQWLVGVKGFDAQRQPLFVGAAFYNGPCVNTQDGTASASGTYGCHLSNGGWLAVNDLRRGTVLLVTKDAGSPLLWPILALLLLSVWITFSFPPRRIWVKIDGDQAHMAALKEHFVNLQRDLDSFARALGNRPLRQADPPLPVPAPSKANNGRSRTPRQQEQS